MLGLPITIPIWLNKEILTSDSRNIQRRSNIKDVNKRPRLIRIVNLSK